MVMVPGRKRYGENGLRTGQDAALSAQLTSFVGPSSTPAPTPVSNVPPPPPQPPPPEAYDPAPPPYVAPGDQSYEPTPGFVSQPVVSEQADAPAAPAPAAGSGAPAAGPLAFLTRKIFGVPVWLAAAAAAAWWMRRRDA